MNRSFVLTLTGADRIGLVDTITKLLFDHGGNVETSRMARLGGEFAILMLVTMPADRFDTLAARLTTLTDHGYKLTTTPTEHSYAEAHPGWVPYRINVEGADHEGIVHEVAHYLSGHGINIESAETETTLAPVSGVPLFKMTARVAVPPRAASEPWEAGLQEIAHRANLEIDVEAVERS